MDLIVEEAYLDSLVKMRTGKLYDLYKIALEVEIERTREKIKELKKNG